METHSIEIALRDGAASWCACSCGWTSEKGPEAEVATAWSTHVAQAALTDAYS